MTDEQPDRFAQTRARAESILEQRIFAHRMTLEQYSADVAISAMVYNMLYTPETRMTVSQLADCLAVAIHRMVTDE